MINFDDNFTVKFIKKRKGNERETKGKRKGNSLHAQFYLN